MSNEITRRDALVMGASAAALAATGANAQTSNIKAADVPAPNLPIEKGAGLRMLALDGAVPVEGGVPILMDAKIVGAIGVSGGTSQQDSEVATVGAAAVK